MSWFSSLAEQAFKLADDLADCIVAQANEAQAQLVEEQKKMEVEEKSRKERLNTTHVLLPWETSVEAKQILSQDLMEKVLALSLNEGNFLQRPPNAEEVFFSFKDFVPAAMKLLEIDTNLARMHAKLSPKMNEEDFWFNYYCRIIYLRAACGIDGAEAQQRVSHWKESDVLFNVMIPVVASQSTASRARPVTPPNVLNTSLETVATSTPAAKLSPIAANVASIEKANKSADDLNLDDLGDLELEENMKDLDILDELDDIDPDEYENIDADELNDELEAQIALELAKDDDL